MKEDIEESAFVYCDTWENCMHPTGKKKKLHCLVRCGIPRLFPPLGRQRHRSSELFFPLNDDWGLPRPLWKICGRLQRLRWLSVENPSLAFNSRDWMSFCFCDLQHTLGDTLKASAPTSLSWQAKLLHPSTCLVETFFVQMPNHQSKSHSGSKSEKRKKFI